MVVLAALTAVLVCVTDDATDAEVIGADGVEEAEARDKVGVEPLTLHICPSAPRRTTSPLGPLRFLTWCEIA